jgi:small-conductance mechanosensitive channel
MGNQTVVNMEIKKRFEALGIDIAFPTQTVYTIAERQD